MSPMGGQRKVAEEVRIAVLMGDGIGPEIITSTMTVLGEAAAQQGVAIDFEVLPAALSALESDDSTLPASTIERLPAFEGWILGPVSHHTYLAGDPRYVSPSGYLRKHFELFANVRPVQSRFGFRPLRDDIDMALVRENTEGFYADRNVLDGNGEFRPDADTVVSVRVVTRRASLRIAEHAFQLAETRRGKVTIIHKANILRRGDGLFLEACDEVARAHPSVDVDELHIDAFATAVVLVPSRFDVLLTTNMFGDILSGEIAGLVGGLGFAPSLNVGVDHAMAQASHGSAPDIAGRGLANPVAAILSGQMLFEWLSRRSGSTSLAAAAAAIEVAVAGALKCGDGCTPDAGGKAATGDVTAAVVRRLRGEGPT